MERTNYTTLAKLLHWSMAVLIFVAWVIGYYSSLLTLKEKIQTDSIMIHKSVASVTLFLIAIRIIWRLTHPAPAAPDGMSSLERSAAKIGHFLLYACMVALPLSGWLWSSAAGYKIPVAEIFFLPPLIDKNPALTVTLSVVHKVLAYMILALICGHVMMALKHHFINRDALLSSMLPRKNRTPHPSRSIT
ncbi:cytochrome b [Cupriavidus necator]